MSRFGLYATFHMKNADYHRQAHNLILEKKWGPLLDVGRARVQVAPSDPVARLLILSGSLFTGDYREAYAQHERLFAPPEEETPATQDDRQDPRTAIRAFAEQLANEHPDNAGARLFFGIALTQIGDLEGALLEYKESTRLDSRDAHAHYFHGQALHTLDRVDMAIREYREAVNLAPTDIRMRLNLGSAYYEQGILESAIAQYREAIKLNPSDSFVHYNLGVALADQGRFEPAIAAYKESARLNPKDALVHYALAGVYETKGRPNEAIAEYEAALQLAPALAAAHSKLGWIYYRQNTVSKALDAFGKAVQHDPEDAQSLHGLGLVKLAMRKEDEAVVLLKQAYAKEEREDKKRIIRGTLVRVGVFQY
jgi:tetratricopeptide (TPR) repeat protein